MIVILKDKNTKINRKKLKVFDEMIFELKIYD